MLWSSVKQNSLCENNIINWLTCWAVHSGITCSTVTRIRVDTIDTSPIIKTGVRLTVVNIYNWKVSFFLEEKNEW